MSLGIVMLGSLTNGPGRAADRLREIGAWLEQRCERLLESPVSMWELDGRRGATVELHPCAEGVMIEVGPGGEIEIAARTTSAGPGYHQYLCELIDEFGARFDIQWAAADPEKGLGDETGHFELRDRAALESQMVRWLGAVGERLTLHEDSGESIAVSMSMDHQFDAGPMIVTPLGPREKAWAEKAALDPWGAVGFFAWWEEGETARVRLNRAVARMWATIRWVEPRTPEEGRAVAMTLRDLEGAWAEDPGLEYPWREWMELCDLVEEEPVCEEVLRERAAAARGPLIGYRRRPVRVPLPGGWNIRVPGAFSETYEEEGGFLAWDEERNVRVSSFSVRCCDDEEHAHRLPTAREMLRDELDPDLPPAVEVLETWEQDGLVGAAKVYRDEDEGTVYWVLMGRVAGLGKLALCTVCYVREEDREWAVETLRSMRRAD